MEPPLSVTYRGVVYKRNPDAEQRAHRVYYNAPRGSGRSMLHRDVWKDHNPGVDIPSGWHVHHRDKDPFNNDPSNLVLLDPKQHAEAHGNPGMPLDHLDRIRHLAADWHRSDAARDLHVSNAHAMWADREYVTKTCEACGDDYQTRGPRDDSRYCSTACIQTAHRRNHTYQVQVPCPVCGELFWQSKYRRKTESCSRKCSWVLRRQRATG